MLATQSSRIFGSTARSSQLGAFGRLRQLRWSSLVTPSAVGDLSASRSAERAADWVSLIGPYFTRIAAAASRIHEVVEQWVGCLAPVKLHEATLLRFGNQVGGI